MKVFLKYIKLFTKMIQINEIYLIILKFRYFFVFLKINDLGILD